MVKIEIKKTKQIKLTKDLKKHNIPLNDKLTDNDYSNIDKNIIYNMKKFKYRKIGRNLFSY